MGESTAAPACCVDGCPCADDGKHKGKPVFSATYGGTQFCCRRSYVRRHYTMNKTTYVAKATAWNKKNPERRRIIIAANYRNTLPGKRDYWLQYNYGISLAEYNEMVMAQCGLCAVCGNSETTKNKATGEVKRLAVHHDHGTGNVIALLCHNCNRGMGMLGDSVENLRRAAEIHSGG